VNVTLTVQVLPAPGLGVSVAPEQLSTLMAKSPGFVPPIVTGGEEEMVRLLRPVLVRVSVRGALGTPTFCGPNGRLVEERFTKGPAGADLNVVDPHTAPVQALTVALPAAAA